MSNIPPAVFKYRLGARGAPEWVVDQYRVKEDQRSGVRPDPDNPADPEYIVRLVGQVVRVSVETVEITAALPQRFAPWPPSGKRERPAIITFSLFHLKLSQNPCGTGF